MFDWSVKGLDFAKMIDPVAAKAAMKTGLNQALTVLENQVKVETPVDTGRLRAGTNHEVREEGNALVGVLGNNAEYAPHVEWGTRPHFPPVKAVAGWARRHGINPFLVARAIAVRGTKAARMFAKVLESPFASNTVSQYVSDALRKVIWK